MPGQVGQNAYSVHVVQSVQLGGDRWYSGGGTDVRMHSLRSAPRISVQPACSLHATQRRDSTFSSCLDGSKCEIFETDSTSSSFAA